MNRKAALIVIDVQQGFVNPHTEIIIPSVIQLVERWTAMGAPIFLSQFRNAPDSPYENITGWVKLRTEGEQAFVRELAPYARSAASIIRKEQSSCLTEEAVGMFRDRGYTDLVLCGIDTDSCVYDSAIDAYHSGFRPWIVTDACASTGGPQYHDAALLLAARNIGSGQLVMSQAVLTQFGTEGACA